eukprot:157721-Lingulodinium_polyedra.AAC.1
MQGLGIEGPLHALLHGAREATWLTYQGCEQPATACEGSKAGGPLGDAVFAAVAARVLKAIL